MNAKQRFSNRVDDYVSYAPDTSIYATRPDL